MDMMFWMELAVVIIAIFIGAKWGGAGLGAAGGIGLGVLVFGFGMQPGAPPVSVLLIITAVITCASILQGSGGLDFLVSIAGEIPRTSLSWARWSATSLHSSAEPHMWLSRSIP